MMHGPMNVKQDYSVDIITKILKINIQLIKTRRYHQWQHFISILLLGTYSTIFFNYKEFYFFVLFFYPCNI